MTLSRYAFIVKGPGYVSDEHTVEIRSQEFNTRVVGVSDFPMALSVVQQLIADDIQLIELCGGFTQSEADELRALTGDAVPINGVK